MSLNLEASFFLDVDRRAWKGGKSSNRFGFHLSRTRGARAGGLWRGEDAEAPRGRGRAGVRSEGAPPGLGRPTPPRPLDPRAQGPATHRRRPGLLTFFFTEAPPRRCLASPQVQAPTSIPPPRVSGASPLQPSRRLLLPKTPLIAGLPEGSGSPKGIPPSSSRCHLLLRLPRNRGQGGERRGSSRAAPRALRAGYPSGRPASTLWTPGRAGPSPSAPELLSPRTRTPGGGTVTIRPRERSQARGGGERQGADLEVKSERGRAGPRPPEATPLAGHVRGLKAELRNSRLLLPPASLG